MSNLVARVLLIVAWSLMSLNMAVEVVRHPAAPDHASSILGLGFCLVILTALIRPKPPVLVRTAATLNGIIAAASAYILAVYLLRDGVSWSEAKDLLIRAFFTVAVPVLTLVYFFADARASTISRATDVSSTSASSAAGGSPSLIYDFGDSGSRMMSFSVPVIMGVSLLMVLLAISAPLVSGPTATTLLQGVFLLMVGSWMGLVGLHFRRDRQAFRTRYLLNDSGIEVTARGASSQSIAWSQVSTAYRSRLLRYLRLKGPLTPDIVLVFGAPPRPEGTGQPKYKRTCGFIAERLGDRMRAGWF